MQEGVFARQQHISAKQESEHFTRKSKVVFEKRIAVGFTARSCQAFQCSGKCQKKTPNLVFSVDASDVARDEGTFFLFVAFRADQTVSVTGVLILSRRAIPWHRWRPGRVMLQLGASLGRNWKAC